MDENTDPRILATGYIGMCSRYFSSLIIAGISAMLVSQIPAAMAQETLPLRVSPVAPSTAETRTDIVWAVDAITPGFIKVEGRLNGYGAQMLDWFIARMPEYNHLVQILPRRSAYDAMRAAGESGKTICIPGTQQTPERAKDFAMSGTVAPLLPLSVVVLSSAHHSFRPYMLANGTIDLAALLGDTSRYTALAKARSYGPEVDSILATAINAPNVLRTDNQSSFPMMLEIGRIDWMLAYPVEIEFHRRQAKDASDTLSLPIQGLPRLMNISVACSRSENGIGAVSKINAILASHPAMPWLEYYIDYLGHEDRARFLDALKEFKQSRDLPVGQ